MGFGGVLVLDVAVPPDLPSPSASLHSPRADQVAACVPGFGDANVKQHINMGKNTLC